MGNLTLQIQWNGYFDYANIHVIGLDLKKSATGGLHANVPHKTRQDFSLCIA